MKRVTVIYILLEILSCFSLGLVFVYIFPQSGKGHLGQSIINTFIIIFFGVIVGIAIVGYFHCKVIGKLNKFPKAVALSFVGLIFFLFLYILQNFLTFGFLPHYLSSVVLPVLFSIFGAVLGFNYALRK